MAVFSIVFEIPEHEDDDIDDGSYMHDMVQDIVVSIEDAGYKYKLTQLS